MESLGDIALFSKRHANSGNETNYEVSHSFTEGMIWGTVFTIGNIVGLIGNSLVIFGSFTYGTFKLDGTTIVFVRNIAMSDVAMIIMYAVPIAVTNFAGKWVFGETMCTIIGHAVSIPAFASINFILIVSIHRYFRCRYPNSTIARTDQKKANIIAILIWFFSCVFIAYTFVVHTKSDFNKKLVACSFKFGEDIPNLVIMSLLTLIPFIVITVINIVLWVYVRAYLKSHGCSDQTKTALLTTAAVTGLFWVMWSPTVARFHLSAIFGDESIPVWLEKTRYLYMFGAYLNPLIYTLINKSFRDFLWGLLQKNCPCNFGPLLRSPSSNSNAVADFSKANAIAKRRSQPNLQESDA
ncbi:hypothetical protein ACHWQZ_G006318 [Mnemiopsis leidyi]